MKKILTLLLMFISSISYANKFCVPTVVLKTQPQSKQQVVKLSENVNLHLTQVIAIDSHEGIRIATNVMCQYLEGASYTGSEKEWKQYIDNTLLGLTNAGYKDVELTIVGDGEKVFQSESDNIEYYLSADNGGNAQLIYNLAILDKSKNRLYSISVSGNEKVKHELYKEFKRVTKTLQL